MSDIKSQESQGTYLVFKEFNWSNPTVVVYEVSKEIQKSRLESILEPLKERYTRKFKTECILNNPIVIELCLSIGHGFDFEREIFDAYNIYRKQKGEKRLDAIPRMSLSHKIHRINAIYYNQEI
jgi:hypothetical protein